MNGLTEIQIIVDSGLFILIWLVQLIIYPSFRYTNEEYFIQWHGRYTFLMGLIVSPLMLIQAGIEGIFLYHDEVRCWRIVPIVLIWLATFSLSVPCHRQLQNHGKVLSTINRLVVTNWIRTLLWSLLFLRTGLAAYHLPLF
ncbi:MAG: hypothetical protein KKB91_03935 [Proteobacteria bacterium]|jgi:hypothetical protein|nr:hypothetical protein [Desulfocapsa sp.]MBU3946200.1 hypothetical protein [Pseudomonadota bacterium]MCG2745212.1 hypothetical protein [Desulfobacteraceae bacterium]MBU4027823.1 hypothetical protein [Pseudomonadota bacterium]MBU4043718.1 hypothetical protein [Pseudomonadota bacterium]